MSFFRIEEKYSLVPMQQASEISISLRVAAYGSDPMSWSLMFSAEKNWNFFSCSYTGCYCSSMICIFLIICGDGKNVSLLHVDIE
jgi:hypothetical protein